MFMVASSVVLTVVVLNYHHRTADIHEMPPWVSLYTIEKKSNIICYIWLTKISFKIGQNWEFDVMVYCWIIPTNIIKSCEIYVHWIALYYRRLINNLLH